MLSEDPAIVIVNPTGDLATGRAYQGTPNVVTSATGKRSFFIWYGNGGPDEDHEGQEHPWESTSNYVMVAYADENLKSDGVSIVIRSPHKDLVRCFDPVGWRDPNGRVWLAWCQSTGEYDFRCKYFEKKNSQWSRFGSTWAIYTDNPDDPEPTWSKPRRLFDGNMINKPTFLKNGTALYPVCQFVMKDIQDMHSQKEGAGVYLSKDNGETFEQISNVRFPDSRYAEHMLVEKNDGTIWMMGRREPSSLRLQRWSNKADNFVNVFAPLDGIVEAFSKDGGYTFGPALFSKIPGIGSRTFIARLKSGNLLLMKSWAEDERWLAGKPKGNTLRPQRRAVTAYISKDDGKTWQGGFYLFDVRATTVPTDKKFTQYPDGSQAVEGENDGFIYITWDYSRFDEPEIHGAKLTEADILAGKVVTKGSIADAVINKGPKSEKPSSAY